MKKKNKSTKDIKENKKKEAKKATVKAKKNSNGKNTIAKSVPYENVYENGVIEVSKGKFSKSYKIPSLNFKTKTGEEQNRIADLYSEFLGSFEPGVDVEITLYNKTVNIKQFEDEIFLQAKGDGLDEYREEYNKMLSDKMKIAKNNLMTEKILTITVNANDIFEANDKLEQIDTMVKENIVMITKVEPIELTLIERLEILNAIYNQDDAIPLDTKRTINGKEVEYFSLENCAKQGITTKDVVAPSGFKFETKKAQVGSRFAKSYYISNYPSWIKGTILTDFSSLPTNSLVSVYFNSIEQGEAVKLIKRQGVNISAEYIERQKKAFRKGYDPSGVSTDIDSSKEEVEILTEQLTQDNGRLFVCNFIITVFADTEEEMKGYEDQLKMIANKNLISIKCLDFQQEAALNSALPLGNKQVYGERLVTSETVGAMIPFDVKEIRQTNGLYYGLHAINHNMIIYNRLSDLNPNGCILGMPGAGKSFAAKREMINVLLNTDDEIYIIDPEREYMPIANALNGSIIKISNGSDTYINPFDMDIRNTDDGGDPIKIKSNFIITLCEIMMDSKFGLSAIEKTIIDKCVRDIYEPYVEYLNATGKTYDTEHAPTMVDFYDALNQQPYTEAQNLALSLERFVHGSLDVFSHHTNVNVTNRFTVYDIKNVGAGLKELALQICLDNVWNKMIANKSENKRTWFYIDEFYLMMQKPSSSAYISEIWKRARKWDGVPCAITQNVEDMLKSEDARTIINNCSFVMLLGQSAINKKQLSALMDISPIEQKYISAAKPGIGLIQIKDEIIPMDDSFPKDTKLYKIMTTKPDERIIA